MIFVPCSLGYDCSERTCPYGDNPVSFIFSVWHSLQSLSFFLLFSLTFLSLVLSSFEFSCQISFFLPCQYFHLFYCAFHLSGLTFKLLKNAIFLHYFCLFSFPSYRARCDFHANINKEEKIKFVRKIKMMINPKKEKLMKIIKRMIKIGKNVKPRI